MNKYFIIILIGVILLIQMLGCSDPNKAEKETNVNVDIIKIVGFKSIFAKNGIYVKLIPMEDSSYNLLISIANYTDTLDYYLTSEIEQRSVPKVLFGTDYVFLITGSSSYRYVTLSYFDKRLDKIITHRYTTGIDVSSDIDGAIFYKDGYCYWYDLDKHELHGMRSDYNLNAFHEATLFGGDSILITGESEIKKYKKQDFSVKCKLLTPNILRLNRSNCIYCKYC